MNPRRLLRIPAVQALLLQCAAYPATLFTIYLLATLRVPVSLGLVAVVQGMLAALFTFKLGLAPWWRLIQLLFPAAVLAAGMLALPPVLYLLVFLLLVGLYWSTYRTQVPLYPSNPAVWEAVARELPPPREGRRPRVVDVGSGMGGMVLHLARARPDCDVTGIELAPLPWLYSRARAALSGGGARFVRGDYESLDFGDYDLVFAYLSPAAMPGLWAKASAEMRPGSLLVSYEFEIAACPPVKTIVTTEHAPSLYVWRF
ncbi:class I SAM-dependent methyltransferase [Pseudoduganella namucuonensis]|uniref:Methyltransferase domain-containing protein n=1 Tax=Pseudoduganella namucuonensis TaxID=1035707 RepID=A0A1I7LF37_9BURK|nr:class I SAM-dependent methyltransferase [Pseudoduganella namucuonensis]SFV08285.1 Methyltransferase domain-containing protein [Pseudoduganella namucuonensis]